MRIAAFHKIDTEKKASAQGEFGDILNYIGF